MSESDEECFLIVDSAGRTPLANISKKNFIKHKLIPGGIIIIHFKRLRFPYQDKWEEASFEFAIEPHNRHVLPIVKRWS